MDGVTYDITVKFAPLVTAERCNDPAWAPDRRLYQNRFKFLPTSETIPLLVDHDDDREIGRIHQLMRLDWIDGPWICGMGTVTDPPSWLSRGTKASFGSWPGLVSEWDIRGTRAQVATEVLMREISVLAPGTDPAEPLAEVLSFRPTEKPKPKPAVRQPSPAVLRRQRASDEMAELDRRIEWLAARGVRADNSVVIENMKAELGYTSGLERLYTSRRGAR